MYVCVCGGGGDPACEELASPYYMYVQMCVLELPNLEEAVISLPFVGHIWC